MVFDGTVKIAADQHEDMNEICRRQKGALGPGVSRR